MKYIKSYSAVSEEIDLRKAIVGGAIGASSLFGAPAVAQKIAKPEISVPADKGPAVAGFIDTLEQECPEIFVENPEDSTIDSVKPLSFLEKRFMEYSMQNPSFGLQLGDLRYISEKEFPFKINYFYVRGIDTQHGPILMPILHFSYTKSMSMYGHEVLFNFTRVTGVSTLGATISF